MRTAQRAHAVPETGSPASRWSDDARELALDARSWSLPVRQLEPAYLTPADYPWLRALLTEYERFVGKKRRDFRLRMQEPLPVPCHARKLRDALQVLERLSTDRTASSAVPRKVRAELFRAAASTDDREDALASAAATLGLTRDLVLESLFLDLPDERILGPLSESIDPAEFALRINAEMVSSLLRKALRIRVLARGNIRAVVRHAKLCGLLCHATPGTTKDSVTLDISGPYALFQHTRVYGRALASLVPRLAWCQHYRFEADCVLDAKSRSVGRLVLSSGAPIKAARELEAFDSKVEECFAKSFAKLAPDWDIIREPNAVAVGESLAFPDFALRHRLKATVWHLEIIGYWTPEYLEHKFAQLRAANIDNMIVCIDDKRACGEGDLPSSARIIRYRTKIDARKVLALIDPDAARDLPVPRARKKRKKRVGRDKSPAPRDP